MQTARSIALAFIVFCGLTADSTAEPAQRMSFRNNLLPGQLTTHVITRTTRRKTKKPEYTETLVYSQEARLIQCNIDESKPGSVMVYQMAEDRPAQVKHLYRGKKEIKPAPSAAMFNLPSPSTRLQSATLTARDAPLQVPLSDPANRVIMQMVMDFAHWPVEKLEAGHRWERTLKLDNFEGTQTFEFVDLVKINDDVNARVTVFVEGQFTGGLEREYEFKKAQVLLHWSRPDRTLTKLEAQASFTHQHDNSPEEFKVKLSARLTNSRLLNEEAQELVKIQLTSFANGLEALRKKDVVTVQRICADYLGQWPDSLWRPAVLELQRQASPGSSSDRLSTNQLKKVLAETFIAWEAARNSREHDLVEKTRSIFKQLAKEYAQKLDRLARDKSDVVRAHAIFALAHGNRPDDLSRVQKALGDKSKRVRAMALAGLTASRPKDVSVEAIIKALDDPEPSVRRRACQTVAACVPPEHYSIVKAVEKVTHLMIYDESDGVRREAVRALGVIGAPADIPSLDKALSHELNQGIRREIERAIKQLQSKSQD